MQTLKAASGGVVAWDRIPGLRRGTQAPDSGAVLRISSENPAARRQNLLAILVGGNRRMRACPGVRESQAGTVDRWQVVCTAEVLGQQIDVSPLEAQRVYLLAGRLPEAAPVT
jgi:hypothetical protein